MENLISAVNDAVAIKQYINGLSSYSGQTNCTVTLTNDGYRIYRTPNVNPSANGNTMWGGLRLQINKIYTLQKGHTYVIKWNVKGKSSNAPTSIGFTNNMGWGGGGLMPAPSNVSYLYTPANFNSEMECYYRFTINDEVYKTCTNSYSSFIAGQTYLSYRDFMFGFGYENTGSMGTDLYLNNFRMYDLTNDSGKVKINLNKTGILSASSVVENALFKAFRDGEIYANDFYEL